MVAPTRPNAKTQGEWRSMGESNYILSALLFFAPFSLLTAFSVGERFGQRHRPYVVHEAKSVSRPLLAEAAAIWPTAFARSATHAFRETAGPGTPSDVNTMFLHAHMLVERAREALLWTWVVAHVGTLDDGWGDAEARQAWAELGGAWDVPEGGKREVEVRAGRRTTLERERVMTMLAQAGVPEGLGKTAYVFCASSIFILSLFEADLILDVAVAVDPVGSFVRRVRVRDARHEGSAEVACVHARRAGGQAAKLSHQL